MIGWASANPTLKIIEFVVQLHCAEHIKPNSPSPRAVIFADPNSAGNFAHVDTIVAGLNIGILVNARCIARDLCGRNADAVAMQASRILLTRLKKPVRRVAKATKSETRQLFFLRA